MSKDIPDFLRGFDLSDDWGMTPVSSTPKAEPSVDPKLVENSNVEISKVKVKLPSKSEITPVSDPTSCIVTPASGVSVSFSKTFP